MMSMALAAVVFPGVRLFDPSDVAAASKVNVEICLLRSP